jgi:nitroreductase
MDVLEAIQNRRSVRNYTGAPVPCEDLEKIVNAGRLAASGNNRQPWEFIVITEPELMAKLRISADHWTEKAGAFIAVVMDSESRWWLEDGAAAVQNMLLASFALGYGACWIEGYTLRNEEIFKQVLAIPDNRRLFTLMTIGTAVEIPGKEKKSLDDVIHWQRYTPRE